MHFAIQQACSAATIYIGRIEATGFPPYVAGTSVLGFLAGRVSNSNECAGQHTQDKPFIFEANIFRLGRRFSTSLWYFFFFFWYPSTTRSPVAAALLGRGKMSFRRGGASAPRNQRFLLLLHEFNTSIGVPEVYYELLDCSVLYYLTPRRWSSSAM